MAATEERSEERGAEGRNVGRIEEITGVVIEAVFPDELPEIFSALEVEMPAAGEGEASPSIGQGQDGSGDEEGEERETKTLVCEVQQHLGDDRVRAVAMDTTDGLSRGTEVVDTGHPITVPVGESTLGRIFNLLGEPIDQKGEVKAEERWPIHRSDPVG